MQGPYGKLWTEFFPSFYGPSVKHAGHENKEERNEDRDQANEANKMFIIIMALLIIPVLKR